ncbi:hypothetical protein NC653_019991 [Populus alba x Populus x berolinensis]|uniref:Uncharacterized protein n=1 Tax=Populus alba x Populus x berolinensis TaxID=444605 RepID=A0AAD6QDA1_9ROSI|nr:hypothetical protein NC653_019991 [Populus alba x Populus x berolinensis]
MDEHYPQMEERVFLTTGSHDYLEAHRNLSSRLRSLLRCIIAIDGSPWRVSKEASIEGIGAVDPFRHLISSFHPRPSPSRSNAVPGFDYKLQRGKTRGPHCFLGLSSKLELLI